MDITAPVGILPDGQQCENRADDQLVVINLLDAISPADGGTLPDGGGATSWDPPEDGVCADDLYWAIVTFQQAQSGVVPVADGVVDPGGATITRMNELAGGGASPVGAGGQLWIWLNAFIPWSVPGLTSVLPDGSGRTVVPGPLTGVSDCFLTDQRDFSADFTASARMHCEALIDLDARTLVHQLHRCDESVEVDCEDGDEEGRAHGDTARMSFTNFRSSSAGRLHVDLMAAANNPLFAGSPDIDAIGTFSIDLTTATVTFSGKVDEFPAFEAYVARPAGAPVTLFQVMPLPGSSPSNLFGGASREVHSTAAF